jgi:hypothetical protein
MEVLMICAAGSSLAEELLLRPDAPSFMLRKRAWSGLKITGMNFMSNCSSRSIVQVCWVGLTCLGIVLVYPFCAFGIVLNDDYFAAEGGDTNNVSGTLDVGYAAARAFSILPQFRTVGAFGVCTGTWIGNNVSLGKSYFLTAAHCFEGNPRTPTRTVSASFTDYDGQPIVSGSATFHLPPERVAPPPGFGGASTDIGILEFDGLADVLAPAGHSLLPAAIYDGNQELGSEVALVGYGSWGIGSAGSNGGLFPSSGPRRAGGTNVINNIFEQSHGISATFNAPGSGDFTPAEVAIASGDSGSAWWQQHDGRWSIIGTTNGGSGNTYGTFSTAARASQYVDWIESIHPDVLLHSDLTAITADINDDTMLNNDDVVAFVDHWLGASTAVNINPADLNVDGIVNLLDWAVLSEELAAVGLSISLEQAFASRQVPEPTALVQLLVALSALLLGRGERHAVVVLQ